MSQRTGEQISLTQCLRSGLKRVAGVGGGRQLGLGGVFWVRRGSVKAHVNPDFEVTMLKCSVCLFPIFCIGSSCGLL